VIGYAGLIYVLLWLAAHVQPDLSWDGNAYHLPTISMWVLRGRVHWIADAFNWPGPQMNGFPKAAEVVGFVLARAGGSKWVNAFNLTFLPLGALGISLLSRLLGASRRLAALAGALYVLVPINIAQSCTTYVDSAYASCAVAALALAVLLWSEQGQSRNVNIGALAALGAALGLALGVKPLGLTLALPTLALAVWALWAGARQRPSPRAFAQAWGGVLLVVAVAAVCGGYWYSRNWLETGSPLYPVGLKVMGVRVFPGLDSAALLDERGMLPAFMRPWSAPARIAYTWAQGLAAYPRSLFLYDSRLGGLGLFWPVACLPAVLAMLALAGRRRLPPPRAAALLALTAAVALAFVGTPEAWWTRFTVWIYALGLPCFAALWTWSLGSPGRPRWVRAWAAGCVGLLVAEGALCSGRVALAANPGTVSFRSSPLALLHSASWRWPAQGFPLFPRETEAFASIVPPEVPVAVGPLEARTYTMLGQLCVPLGVRNIMSLPAACPASALRQAKTRGIRYVLWDNLVAVSPALESGTAVVGRTDYFTLRELR
jgi:hypothetical protein